MATRGPAGKPVVYDVNHGREEIRSVIDQKLPQDFHFAVQNFEMFLIKQALDFTNGNKDQASLLLGLARSTLLEKISRWHLRDGGG